jgi:hypothetical protein
LPQVGQAWCGSIGLWHCGHEANCCGLIAVWLSRFRARELVFLRFGKGPIFYSVLDVFFLDFILASADHLGSFSSDGQSHCASLRFLPQVCAVGFAENFYRQRRQYILADRIIEVKNVVLVDGERANFFRRGQCRSAQDIYRRKELLFEFYCQRMPEMPEAAAAY